MIAGYFQSENVFQIPVTLQGKTSFDMQGTTSFKIDDFIKKKKKKKKPSGNRRP